ncbi:FkbM family methyltransferase [Micromonospora sp. C31]|uniref:FkbM family methyltransferase n=1 Tax=Micromonospora sp. C31 TaxID=2824876 RepID=UPI001B3636A4|nr:FkbM family methyltransferase [Micromonospora sp. C31]MBQ1076227.1 FkbM family methyltransferase [Micromonospora sp. C31]
MEAALREATTPRTGAPPPRPVAFLFPGLGDHHPDMGRHLYRDFTAFAETVDTCAELLRAELDRDIREVIFAGPARPAGQSGGLDLRALLGRGQPAAADSELDRTALAQPALFVVEYALARLWQRWGLQPEVMLGYSLGEYVAACLAQVLTLEESLTLVARRARLIESLPPGAMLAVTLPEEELLPLLTEGLSLSAVNGPEFCVVAGPVDEVGALRELLAARDVVTRPVRSGHAFHSAMMLPIADQVTELARTLHPRPPRIPYVSNVTGELITAAEATDPGYWARHLCSPVRFAEGLRTVAGERLLLEVGPGQTLSSMATSFRGGDPGAVVASMRHPLDGQDDSEVLLRAVSRLRQAGADLDWQRLPAGDTPAPDAPASSKAGGPTPATPTETALTELWARLLKTDDIPRDVSFFDLGGNSLTASRLALRITRRFGVELTLRTIYGNPTVARMAAVIDGQTPPAEPAATTPAAPGRNLVTLPNGLTVSQQNEAETKHFYEDIFEHRGYARHGVTIADGATVVDVGGNIGLFTLFAHAEAKDVRIFTFEPAPPMFAHLSHNVAAHGVDATLFNIGLSDHEGTAEFTFYPRSSGMSSFHPDEDEEKRNLRTVIANQFSSDGPAPELVGFAEELVDVRFEAVPFTARLRTLSSVIREEGIAQIDLIKIDVQKAELDVVRGIDDEHWPLIRQMVLEAHDGDGRVDLLRRMLVGHGFQVLAVQDELYAGTDIYTIYATRDGR